MGSKIVLKFWLMEDDTYYMRETVTFDKSVTIKFRDGSTTIISLNDLRDQALKERDLKFIPELIRLGWAVKGSLTFKLE